MDASSLRAAAAARRHRALVVLDGDAVEVRAQATALIQGNSAWLAPPGTWACDGMRWLTGRRSRLVLSEPLDTLIIDGHASIDPDAFAASLSSVGAGGLVVLLLPPEGAPDASRDTLVTTPFLAHHVGDRFVARFRRAAARAQERALPESAPRRWEDEQAAAVEIAVASSRAAPVLLVGDAGRGKSSVLGLAAAGLLSSGEVDDAVLSAPTTASAASAFARLRELRGQDHGVRFELARDLLGAPVPLLLLDDAATLPVPILERLLRMHPRIVISATVHGFGGAGEAFLDRLRGTLDRLTPGWTEVALTEPVMWAAGCPVEAFANDALALAPMLATADAVAAASPRDGRFVTFDRAELAANEPVLGELFALLTLAHTRTPPADFRRLLDAPNATVSAWMHGSHVVAAALIAAEGALPEEDAEAALTGRLRPEGHMLPEILATHLGCREGAELPTARIVRFAVHPAARGRGLGAHLLECVAEQARGRGAKLTGAGFGATADVVRFFGGAGLHPIRTGVRRSASAGVYSTIVMRSLDPTAEALVAELHQRYVARLPHQLADPNRDLDHGLAYELFGVLGPDRPRADRLPGLHAPPETDLELSAADFDDLLAIAFGPRIYDGAVAPVCSLVLRAMSDTRFQGAFKPGARELLLAKAVDKLGWTEVMERFRYPDLASTAEAFRQALVPLVLVLGGNAAEYARARYTSAKPLGPADPSVRTAALRRLGFSVADVVVPDRRKARMKQVLQGRQLDLEIVLETIWDPHNVAAILRSADAFGVGAIDLVYNEGEPFPRISDMAAGYTKRWSLMNKHRSIEACYAAARARGLQIVATGPAAGCKSYLEVDWTRPSALVIGHERDGCSEYALEHADVVVIIPMAGFAQSLNVSVATAVILAEIVRQRTDRRASEPDWTPWHDATLNQWVARDEQGAEWKPIWPPDVQPSEGDE
ncbi:MAG: GNAT family N-acetyltransferase [Proteobacteria bacterium]|nr:GNAT family N-acetyltransferase [Pseudomonadota bacterium]